MSSFQYKGTDISSLVAATQGPGPTLTDTPSFKTLPRRNKNVVASDSTNGIYQNKFGFGYTSSSGDLTSPLASYYIPYTLTFAGSNTGNSGTFSIPSYFKAFNCILVGGGGGGGGSGNSKSPATSGPGGGGGGAGTSVFLQYIKIPSGAYSVQWVAGAAGSSSFWGQNGGNGGTTSITFNGTTIYAYGGKGGSAGARVEDGNPSPQDTVAGDGGDGTLVNATNTTPNYPPLTAKKSGTATTGGGPAGAPINDSFTYGGIFPDYIAATYGYGGNGGAGVFNSGNSGSPGLSGKGGFVAIYLFKS